MIIFINGSINSGKSTVSNLLAKQMDNTIVFEIDDIMKKIGRGPIDKALPAVHNQAIKELKKKARGSKNIIIPYPLSKENYEKFFNELEVIDNDILAFTLSPRLAVVIKDRGNRKLSDWEKKRIKYHYSIDINNPKYGCIVDNSDETVEQTVSAILAKIMTKSL